MTKTAITIEFDMDNLGRYEDSYLATLWHVAQANPADGFESNEPNEIAERIGREIIRRWLSKAPVELYHHQGRHYYWKQLTTLGKWVDGVFVPNAAEPVEVTPDA
jgi:hypothetical protein